MTERELPPTLSKGGKLEVSLSFEPEEVLISFLRKNKIY